MNVGFLGTELARWDQALREAGSDNGTRMAALGLPFFEDERPLRGAGGLCDWRLGGRLSRLLGAGGTARFTGRFGDRLLMPSGSRLPWERIVLFGLGPSAGFDEHRARVAARELLHTLHELCPAATATEPDKPRPTTIAIVPPGRSTGALSARQALEVLLEEAPGVFGSAPAELVVVESAAGQKEAAELARRHC